MDCQWKEIRGRPKAEVLLSAETVYATESKAGLSAEN